MSKKPKNWPENIPYLTHPLLSKDLTTTHKQALTSPSSSTLPTIPPSSLTLPCPLVKILPITTPSHPAYPQNGLFATRTLPAGSFIIPYLGRTHTSSTTDPKSDYDLWLDREADIAVDAGKSGNEARFVNDYRGVRERPNAEFGVGWCEAWGMVCVGFWVRRGKREGIRKGEEILVSYGKGFWGERKDEEEGDDVCGG